MRIRRRRRYILYTLQVVFVLLAVGTTLIGVAAKVVEQTYPEFVDGSCIYYDEEEHLARERAMEEAGNTIYLTFDDGPGPYTAELLDTLQRYGVRATFFVTGAGDDDLILREYREGHAVGLHTLSHNYAYIYASIENFMADLVAVQERVRRITGYESHLMRFPGGSSNTVSALYDGGAGIMSQLAPEVERRGFYYFDWNIASGDAGGADDTEMIYARVTEALHEGQNIVLMHDIKDFSVAAVPRIIEYGKSHGFQFAALKEKSFGAHHGINN